MVRAVPAELTPAPPASWGSIGTPTCGGHHATVPPAGAANGASSAASASTAKTSSAAFLDRAMAIASCRLRSGSV